MAELTQKQAKLLDFLRHRIDEGEPPPTYRELCSRFGWASTATARDHLRALHQKGYVELGGGKARRIRLVDNLVPVVRVPVAGEIVAGVPIGTEESFIGSLPIPAEWVRRGVHYALRVHGDSMKDAGILPGDQVVIRKQAAADEGEIVVATIEGETTLKRLARRGGKSLLQAENSAYPAIEVRTAASVIHGVVVGLLRSYTGSTAASRRGQRIGPRSGREGATNAHGA